MKHSWYKYFSRNEYADAFLGGEVLFRSLAYFRDYEDKSARHVIGDAYEGTRSFMPDGGLMTRNHSTGEIVKFTEPWAFESVVKADEVFVFCVSNSFKDVLVREFNAVACVEITNQREFFNRLRPALPLGAELVWGNVTYYQQGDMPNTTWGLPDQIVKLKLSHFSYQEEYRFAYSTTDAWSAKNCRYRLIGRERRPAPNLNEHHERKLLLGNLCDICKLHHCDDSHLADIMA